MTNDKTHAFLQRWRELEAEGKSLDWRRSLWAKDLRAEFPSGQAGNDGFVEWLRIELGLDGVKCNEMVTRAEAAKIVKDEKTFRRLGGSRATAWLTKLPREKVVPVIESAKAERKNVHQVIRERGLLADDRRHNYHRDAEAMARRLIQIDRAMPEDLREIVRRYVADARKAA